MPRADTAFHHPALAVLFRDQRKEKEDQGPDNNNNKTPGFPTRTYMSTAQRRLRAACRVRPCRQRQTAVVVVVFNTTKKERICTVTDVPIVTAAAPVRGNGETPPKRFAVHCVPAAADAHNSDENEGPLGDSNRASTTLLLLLLLLGLLGLPWLVPLLLLSFGESSLLPPWLLPPPPLLGDTGDDTDCTRLCLRVMSGGHTFKMGPFIYSKPAKPLCGITRGTRENFYFEPRLYLCRRVCRYKSLFGIRRAHGDGTQKQTAIT